MAGFPVHFTLTLTGAVQRLSDALPTIKSPGHKGGVGGMHDISCRALILQPDGGNGNPIYVGGVAGGTTDAYDNQTTPLVASVPGAATDYGFRLEKGTTGVPPAPFVLEMYGSKISDWYVIGTAAEKLHFQWMPL